MLRLKLNYVSKRGPKYPLVLPHKASAACSDIQPLILWLISKLYFICYSILLIIYNVKPVLFLSDKMCLQSNDTVANVLACFVQVIAFTFNVNCIRTGELRNDRWKPWSTLEWTAISIFVWFYFFDTETLGDWQTMTYSVAQYHHLIVPYINRNGTLNYMMLIWCFYQNDIWKCSVPRQYTDFVQSSNYPYNHTFEMCSNNLCIPFY